MKWENIIGAIFAAPSIILDLIVRSAKLFYMQESEVYHGRDYQEEDTEE